MLAGKHSRAAQLLSCRRASQIEALLRYQDQVRAVVKIWARVDVLLSIDVLYDLLAVDLLRPGPALGCA